MKREVLFEASKALARVEDRLVRVQSVVSVAREHIGSPDWVEFWHENLVGWREASAAFDGVIGLVTVVCSPETTAACLKFRSLAVAIMTALAKKDQSVYDMRADELTKKGFEIRVAIRKELGITALS